MGPSDQDRHPTDASLRRRVAQPPGWGDVWMGCDEEDELPADESCMGCPSWGVDCWAWYRLDR